MDKHVDQAIEGKLVKLGYSFPEKWQKRYDCYFNAMNHKINLLKRFFRLVGNEIRYWKKKKVNGSDFQIFFNNNM